MTRDKLLAMLKTEVENESTIEKLKVKVTEIIKQDRYEHIAEEEGFINFRGGISYDYSGYVQANDDLEIDVDNILELEFDNIYTGEKRASYVSNMGWFHTSFLDQLKEDWEDIKYDIYNQFVEEHKASIVQLFDIQDWEWVHDGLDGSELGDYIVFDSDEFLEKFINKPVKTYLDEDVK